MSAAGPRSSPVPDNLARPVADQPLTSDTDLVLKTELHTHTDLDPKDRIPHSTTQLLDRAADLGLSRHRRHAS